MKRLQRLIAVFLAVACVVCARADLVPPTNAAPTAGLSPAGGESASAERGAARFVDELLAGVLPWSSQALPSEPVVCEQGDVRPTGDVVSLPAGPSSASLFLFALGGLGAWNLGRSVRKIHLGALPEWYHTGGPAQVGHATPLNLDFTLAALPLCRFEAPLAMGAEECSRWRMWREPGDRLRLQLSFLPTDPRGPPLHS